MGAQAASILGLVAALASNSQWEVGSSVGGKHTHTRTFDFGLYVTLKTSTHILMAKTSYMDNLIAKEAGKHTSKEGYQ